MNINIYLKFSKIRKDWERLYEVTPEVSPFLESSAFAISLRYWYPYLIKRRAYYLFAAFSDNNGVRCIIPLFKDKNGYELFGNENGFNECGCVYDDINVVADCFEQFKQEFGNIKCSKISEHTSLASIAKNRSVNCKNCVKIAFPAGHQVWFKQLSSSVRQNMRTSYNRLEKDGLKYEFGLLDTKDKKLFDEVIYIYIYRHLQRYSVKTGVLKKWFLKNQSFATNFYKKANNAITFYLKINGKPVAFMSGLYSGQSLVIPRLSIDSEFSRYSPGYILINEAIKYLDENTDIRVLDLSKGEEEYKYKLGGTLYQQFEFVI